MGFQGREFNNRRAKKALGRLLARARELGHLGLRDIVQCLPQGDHEVWCMARGGHSSLATLPILSVVPAPTRKNWKYKLGFLPL